MLRGSTLNGGDPSHIRGGQPGEIERKRERERKRNRYFQFLMGDGARACDQTGDLDRFVIAIRELGA